MEIQVPRSSKKLSKPLLGRKHFPDFILNAACRCLSCGGRGRVVPSYRTEHGPRVLHASVQFRCDPCERTVWRDMCLQCGAVLSRDWDKPHHYSGCQIYARRLCPKCGFEEVQDRRGYDPQERWYGPDEAPPGWEYTAFATVMGEPNPDAPLTQMARPSSKPRGEEWR